MADAVKQCVYVWDAMNTIHRDAAKALSKFIQGDYFNIKLFFTGTALMEGTSLTYQNSDMVDSVVRLAKKGKPGKDDYLFNIGKKILDGKDEFANLYSFADRYIDGISAFFKSL